MALTEPHESPWIMTVPLIVLAVLSTVGGFIGVPYALEFHRSPTKDMNVIEHTLEPVVAHIPAGGTPQAHNEGEASAPAP